MADVTQCDNCGAVLLEKDLFCGECGAPRSTPQEPPEPEAAVPTVASGSTAGSVPVATPESAPSEVPPTRQARVPATGWKVVFAVLLVLGVLACLAGLLTFVLLGSTPSEETTVQEDWLYAAVCCLLPLGGTGLALLAAGVTIWFSRLRGN